MPSYLIEYFMGLFEISSGSNSLTDCVCTHHVGYSGDGYIVPALEDLVVQVYRV